MGQCGAKQGELIEKRKQAMAGQREKAEQFLERLEFQQAVRLAKELGGEPDLRLQHLKPWSQKFVEQAEKIQQEQLARLANLVSEAVKHEQAYDYSSAIHTLEQVPEALQRQSVEQLPGMTAESLLKRVRHKQQEVQRLDKLIRQKVSSRQLNGLQSDVDQFLALSPTHPEMGKLRQQLIDRHTKFIATRDEAYAAAKACMESQEYEKVLRELGRIDPSVMLPEFEKLRQQATETLNRILSLRKSIDTAVKQKNYHGLLTKVEELLELQPNDESMKSLKSQLLARDAKNASQIQEIVAQAEGLFQAARFAQASTALTRIPLELRTEEVNDLLQRCDYMAFERESALMALSNAVKSENYSYGISSTQAYRGKLAEVSLQDQEFLSQFQICQEGLTQQKAAAAAAEYQRKAMRYFGLIAAGLVVAAILVGIGLWIRSSMRASAIAKALEQQRWDEVLELEPDNIEAFIGRAEQELNRVNSNQAKVTADIDRAAAISSDHPRLMSLKTLAAEKVKAEADRIAAEKAKAEADRLAAEQAKAILAERPALNSINLALKKLPGGTFTMGEGSEAHEVTLTRPFYIGVYEVTREQYKRVVRNLLEDATPPRPGFVRPKLEDPQNPQEGVSWEDAAEFCRKLSELPEEKAAGRVYRLPTEAEWEYACRAGTTSKFSFGDDETQFGEHGWHVGNSSGKTHSVGQKKSNPWGLYDMHGNVWEWCADWYGDYPKGPVTDPVGPSSGSLRVDRGGGWYFEAAFCRSANRSGGSPSGRSRDIGFRVALSLDGEPNKAANGSSTPTVLGGNAPTSNDPLGPGFRGSPGDSGPVEPNGTTEKKSTGVDRTNSIGMQFKLLPNGTFTMGEGSEAHPVTLAKPFYMGVHEVTQEQYERVMRKNPSHSSLKGPRSPVNQVSWGDAVAFCRKLSELPEEEGAGRVYRLPTEAEWEYACRAGTTTAFSFGDDESRLDYYGWFGDNSRGKPQPVGQKQPNSWGLYDMHGNVWEWCSDWEGNYLKGSVTDPVGPEKGLRRVGRGGSWGYEAANCRSAVRSAGEPSNPNGFVGFRVVMTPSESSK